MASFVREINGLIDREGMFANDPDDSGGPTKHGISQKSYPDLDIKSLTRLNVSAIYLEDFWLPLKCDEINSQKVASLLFDAGVNHGASRATKMIQAASGAVIDGYLGPRTLSKINGHRNQDHLAAIFTLIRVQFYGRIVAKRSSQKKFLAGWVARATDLFFSQPGGC